MLRVRLHQRARKQLRKLPRSVQSRMVKALDGVALLSHPLKHRHVIKLTGRKDATDFRLRVGDYRVKFSMIGKREILVLRIEHRQAGY